MSFFETSHTTLKFCKNAKKLKNKIKFHAIQIQTLKCKIKTNQLQKFNLPYFQLLSVNERSGEIRLQGTLDHEQEPELVVLVIPTDGSPSQKVIIEVEDANDNTPTFASPSVQVRSGVCEHISNFCF
jgi:hypothetical protein